MESVKELSRHPSPGGRPQPLAYRDGTLWMGAWDTDTIYAIEPRSWKVIDQMAAPGRPYGIAPVGDYLQLVVSIGEDDDRYFYRFTPGEGFDDDSKTPCPEFTGSHLISDGSTLYMTQMGFRRILELDKDLNTRREIALPTRCGGIGLRDGTFYMITADDEFDNLELATLDVSMSAPQAAPVAVMPPEARALAWDGSAWWTSHREESRIASFEV